MTQRVYFYLESFARFLFFLLLILNLVNWIVAATTELTSYTLPFSIDESEFTIITNEESDQLNGMVLVAVDTLQIEAASGKKNIPLPGLNEREGVQ
jgi:hypothetical protein